ncbi:MAG: YeiH family protein, partial [Acidobacteriota bacterium]
MRIWRALALIVAGTVAATAIGELDRAPSPIAVAMLLGLLASPFVHLDEASPVPVIGKFALRTGVVLLGFRITLDEIADLGAVTLVMAVVVSVSVLAATVWIGRRTSVGRTLATLLGVGSAICGASAVAAAGTTIESSDEDTAYAIATVTLIGTIATFALPALGSWAGLGDRDLGIWIGMMVHDVGQVVAASTTVGDVALTAAVPVKLVRVLLLVPERRPSARRRRRSSTRPPPGRRRGPSCRSRSRDRDRRDP